MSKKLLVVLALAGMLGGGLYKLVLAEPQHAVAGNRISVMRHQVVVDLAGGRYATVTIGVEVPPKSEAEIGESGVVRDVVTRDLTNVDPGDLLVRERRELLKLRLARDIRAQTHVKVGRVLLTDFTIQ
jgi:hypothetical protein